MSGGGGSQTVKNEPPKYLRPYLQDVAGQASGLYRNQGFFPGQTYAGFAPEQEQAMGLQTSRALTGSPVNQSAQDMTAATLRGDYLHGGPGFDAAYQAAANRIIPQVNSAFGRAGRSGSGLAQTAMTGALGDAFASQYGQERGRQMQAAQMAPGLAAQDYFDIGQLGQVGAQRQAMQQMGIDEAMARHDFPWTNLERYASILNPQAAMGGTQTSPMYQNRAAGALGGAMLGSYFGPVGMAGGALLGAFA